jgi:hypothetical protein
MGKSRGQQGPDQRGRQILENDLPAASQKTQIGPGGQTLLGVLG